ncbi:unnamed protein product, partial [Protopolystoma xenopodis]
MSRGLHQPERRIEAKRLQYNGIQPFSSGDIDLRNSSSCIFIRNESLPNNVTYISQYFTPLLGYISINQQFTLSATLKYGSNVRFTFDFGDGSVPVNIDGTPATPPPSQVLSSHVYLETGQFKTSVIARSGGVQINIDRLLYVIAPLGVYTLNLTKSLVASNSPATIVVTWKSGPFAELTQAKVSWNDSTPMVTADFTDNQTYTHTYLERGNYIIT